MGWELVIWLCDPGVHLWTSGAASIKWSMVRFSLRGATLWPAWVSALAQILHVGCCEKGLVGLIPLGSSPPLPATHQSRSILELFFSWLLGRRRGVGRLWVWVRGLRVWGEQVRSVKEMLALCFAAKRIFPQSPFILSDKGSICLFLIM